MTVVTSNYARKENDLYQTEPWATEALLRHFPAQGASVWEPSAGNHLMADVLRDHGARVRTSDIAVYDRPHDAMFDFLKRTQDEEAASREYTSQGRKNRALGVAPERDRDALSGRQRISTPNGEKIRSDAIGILFGDTSHGDTDQTEMAGWNGERPIYRRYAKHTLSGNGEKETMQSVRVDGQFACPPYGWGPYEQHDGQFGSPLLAVPHQSPQNGILGFKADCIVTNPPYGKGNRQAAQYARFALERCAGRVALLLTAKFDFGKTRMDLFAKNSRFIAKIALVDRIQWFPGDTTGTEDHAWYVWGPEQNHTHARLLYAGRKP